LDPQPILTAFGKFGGALNLDLQLVGEAVTCAHQAALDLFAKIFGDKLATENSRLVLRHAAQMDANQIDGKDVYSTRSMVIALHRIQDGKTNFRQLGGVFGDTPAAERGFEDGSAEFFDDVGYHCRITPRSLARSTICRAMGAANC